MTKYDEISERLQREKELQDKEIEDMMLGAEKLGISLAKDGLPFDIDNFGGELRSDEVEIIQFLRPDYRRRRMSTVVGESYVKKAENLILSAEDLGTGKIALWARKVGEGEERDRMMLADNGPGENSPSMVLCRLIDKVYHESKINSTSVKS